MVFYLLLYFAHLSPKKVVCFGNVLLDHLALLDDTQLLDEFDLKLETKGELDVDALTKITAAACDRFVRQNNLTF